jgi:hypothetical protein
MSLLALSAGAAGVRAFVLPADCSAGAEALRLAVILPTAGEASQCLGLVCAQFAERNCGRQISGLSLSIAVAGRSPRGATWVKKT